MLTKKYSKAATFDSHEAAAEVADEYREETRAMTPSRHPMVVADDQGVYRVKVMVGDRFTAYLKQ